MKKKLVTLFITFILLFSIAVPTAYAASTVVDFFFGSGATGKTGTFNRYRWYPNTTKTLKANGWIDSDWYVESQGVSLCANDPHLYDDPDNPPTTPSNVGACRKQVAFWNLYQVKVGSKIYVCYCVNPRRGIDNGATVGEYESLASMEFQDTHISDEEREKRIERLERLLLYGHNISPNNDKSLSSILGSETKNYNETHAKIYLRAIAMQVLVYEIAEGGRTSFDTIEPNVWGADENDPNQRNSMYLRMIKPNGGDDPDREGTLYYYYKQAIENARIADQAIPSTGLDEKEHIMTWDSVNKKYSTTIDGLGTYGIEGQCTSDNPKVTVTQDKTNASMTISSTQTIKNAKITCKYSRGNGTTKDVFRFFRFAEPDMQDMLYASGYKELSRYVTVSTENSELLIKKVDVDNRPVSGAKFTLTHSNVDLNYSTEIDGNGSSKNLIYGGSYRVSETTAPDGYDKINDFNISIKGETHKIIDCTGKKIDDAGTVVSCLNNQVKVAYANNGTIELTIVDMPKNIKILKVNKDGSPLAGAAFEIRDKNGNLIRFTKNQGSNFYRYDPAGQITTISDPNSSSYPISLLPEGEYKIIETAAPANYRLPIDEESRTTLIKIGANRELSVYDNARKTYVPAGTATVTVVNYNTNIKIHKTGNGKPLPGVQFELYNADKSIKLKSIVESAGVYNYTDDQTVDGNTVYITNSTGDITIKNVPEGTYYLKEIATVDPYVLPGGDGVYTKVEIKIDANGVSVNGNYALNTIEISNTPNSFNFYKRDPEGNSLSGGKYKLQKFDNKEKKYVDVKLAEVQNDGTYADNTDIFKEDKTNGKIQFTLTKGVATFIDMQSATTYRIIELEAPEGFDKISAEDTAMVTIDEYGNASGLLVLVDPRPAPEDASAFAELIINIQTGKQRIMYAAVIVIVISLIAGLIIFNRKKGKENK